MQLKLGLFCLALHPWPSSTEKYPHLGNFPCECTTYEAMIFRGLCWRDLTNEEGILAWGSKDQEQIEFRELAWKWSWLMLTIIIWSVSGWNNCCCLSEDSLWSWRRDGVEAEHLFCSLQLFLLPVGLKEVLNQSRIWSSPGSGGWWRDSSQGLSQCTGFSELLGRIPRMMSQNMDSFSFYPDLSSMLLFSDISIVWRQQFY